MTTKWPEMRRGPEIAEFNRGFLELVRSGGGVAAAFGLEPAVRERLASMTGSQLDLVADMPCLLAGVPAPLVAGATGVSDPGPRELAEPPAGPTQIYAAALLAWLWQAIRQDPLVAALCLGPGPELRDALARAPLRELQRAAARSGRHLEARFCRHPRFWPDLVRAAATGDARLLLATRVSAVQLTLVRRVPRAPLPPPGQRRTPRPR